MVFVERSADSTRKVSGGVRRNGRMIRPPPSLIPETAECICCICERCACCRCSPSVPRHAVPSSDFSNRTGRWCRESPNSSVECCWVLDLTDLSHAATRHKTHKKRERCGCHCPRCCLRICRCSDRRVLDRWGFDLVCYFLYGTDEFDFVHSFVKQTFRKYTTVTTHGQAHNPSLLRSIFTTWRYSLRYDTEDPFLQQIKASSTKWKAHSEHVAATVYNKELMYQKKETRPKVQQSMVHAGDV